MAAPSDVPEGTLRYYVGKHVLVVTGTVKRHWEPYVATAQASGGEAEDKRGSTPDGGATSPGTEGAKPKKQTTAERRDDTPFGNIEFREVTSWTGQMDLQVVPDTSRAFWMQYVPGDSSDDKLTVNLGGNGILTSIDVTVTSQEAEIVKNVATFAGILGATIESSTLVGRPGGMNALQRPAPSKAVAPASLKGAMLGALASEAATEREKALATTTLEDLDAHMPPLWRVAFGDVRGGQRALRLCVHQVYLDAVIAARQEDRIALQREFRAAEAAALPALTSRLAGITTAIEALTNERTATAAAFTSEMGAYLDFLRRADCGREDREDRVVRLLELNDLPSQHDIGADTATATRLEARQVQARLLGRHARARELLEQAHVLVTLDLSPGPRGSTPGRCAAPSGEGGTGAPAGRIYYRQSRPAVLRVWEPRQDVPTGGSSCQVDASLVVTSQRIVDVLDPDAAPQYVEFDPLAFATSHLMLTLGPGGQLTAITQESSAALKNLTGALASGATNVRDQYASTLKAAADNEDVKRRLRLADLTADVEMKKKEKEMVDAEVALAGASASRELLEQQAVAAEQLKLATARISLEKAQATGSTQVQTEATQQEVNRLTAEVNLLKQQIELIKQRQALEAARPQPAGGGGSPQK